MERKTLKELKMLYDSGAIPTLQYIRSLEARARQASGSIPFVIGSFIGKCHPTDGIERVPINIDPAVRKRLRDLLEDFPEFHTVGYSAFINRAVELAEGEAMNYRRDAMSV